MKDFKSKFGFILFFLFVVGLAVGGFFFTRHTLQNKNDNKKSKINYKIDKKKDFIYYINESVISEDAEIDYKDVVINIKGQEILTETLKKENQMYKNSIKYIKDQKLVSNELIKHNYDDLYALKFRRYENYEFKNYVSLVVKEYDYTCFDFVTFDKVFGYVFDTNTGEIIKEDKLLSIYNTNIDNIKVKIREFLASKQGSTDGVDIIKIDETADNLTNYTIYVNEYGKLVISFLVKTNESDYNEVMEV